MLGAVAASHGEGATTGIAYLTTSRFVLPQVSAGHADLSDDDLLIAYLDRMPTRT